MTKLAAPRTGAALLGARSLTVPSPLARAQAIVTSLSSVGGASRSRTVATGVAAAVGLSCLRLAAFGRERSVRSAEAERSGCRRDGHGADGQRLAGRRADASAAQQARHQTPAASAATI